jgi:hypothetical protein
MYTSYKRNMWDNYINKLDGSEKEVEGQLMEEYLRLWFALYQGLVQ